MATKDNRSGLLSKFARFVSNPTRDWSELDKPESDPESVYGKQVLKETIERKRRNDFVRRREFDYLRKLRRDGLLIDPNQLGRPSFFQSSTTFSSDERAVTLKKIDEIEAQMSNQWWTVQSNEASAQDGNRPARAELSRVAWNSAVASPVTPAKTNVFASTQGPDRRAVARPAPAVGYESTQVGQSVYGAPAPSRVPPRAVPPRSAERKNINLRSDGYSTANLISTELGDRLADPDLEEASIRFANGDDAGAEAGLLVALQADAVASEAAQRWAAALFDLYRATGQQVNFDCIAIDYAQRFGRSAPRWYSTPDLLAHEELLSPLAQLAAPAPPSPTSWECPAELDLPVVEALQASLSRVDSPWYLNWSGLNAVTPDAVKALAKLFAQWCTEPVTLYFEGADVLEKLLRDGAPSCDKRVDPCWWRLRLDILRILGLQDEFEFVALDYCVTYEVSPPPWSDPLCEYVEGSVPSPLPEEVVPPPSLGAVDTGPGGPDAIAATLVELAGEVLGDAAGSLDKFQAELKGSNRLVISCARLIRVDFSAAGSILNWVALRQSEGCQVEFREVPRLVGAFFNVIGINEHAQVVLRTS